MKKLLKTLALCCLFMAIGIFIGSSSKSLLNNAFSRVNSSPESVVENYITAAHFNDKETMIKCLSPDLNNIDSLKYFYERGSRTATDFLEIYSKYLYYKENPPQDLDVTDEELKFHNEMMNKVESKELIDIYVDSTISYVQESVEMIGGLDGFSIKADLIGEEEYYLSDKDADENYIGMTFNLTVTNNGESGTDDEYIVIQRKLGKYYIVDMFTDWY